MFITKANALAAGQGGSASNNLAPQSQTLAPHAPTEENPTAPHALAVSPAPSQVAKALAQAAQVERRSRTIIETIQRPDPENAGLNSIFSQGQNTSPEQRAKIRDALECALLQFLQEQKQDREQKEGQAIGSLI